MAIFYDFVLMLDQQGVVQVLLPFALVFTIVFAILNKTRILGTYPASKEGGKARPKTNLNAMVALVMGLSVIFIHIFGMYPVNRDPVEIINRSLTSVSLVLVATVMVLILVGSLFGGRTLNVDGGFKISNIIKWVAVLIILYIFAVNMGFLTFGGLFISRQTQIAVVSLLVFGLVIWFVVKPDKPKYKKGESPWDKQYKPTLLLGDRNKK